MSVQWPPVVDRQWITFLQTQPPHLKQPCSDSCTRGGAGAVQGALRQQQHQHQHQPGSSPPGLQGLLSKPSSEHCLAVSTLLLAVLFWCAIVSCSVVGA